MAQNVGAAEIEANENRRRETEFWKKLLIFKRFLSTADKLKP